MQFLFPAFLWALLALSIPIIIHLFYFRRFKKVYFTNVKYLKEIKEETSNRNKLKNLLILISRCLAVACLVFAFAQPFIPKGTGIKSGLNYVSVFVDNSFSMSANKSEIPLIDIAKDKARSVVSSYGDEDRFQILTHDFEGKHQRLLSKEDALTYIDDVQITSSVQDLDLVLNRQRQLLESSSGNRLSYIISDFQQSIVNLQGYQDTTMEINLVPVQSTAQKNVTIDSAWFEGPIPFLNQTNKLLVKVKNNSPEDIEQVKISFLKEGQEKPVAIRDIAANSTVTDTVNLTIDKSGWHTGILQVSDYPVQFDDKYYISFNVADTIKALFINDTGLTDL
ncbi:MAG: BatA and WFA domain-containing protein [Saprospiraceae bacterium]|nr:BatA and WFA domain-containing protein [Saprospiraceae bacterium]